MKRKYETLQENFGDTVGTYIQQNLGIEIEDAENKAYKWASTRENMSSGFPTR